MSYHQTIYNLLRGYGLSEAGALGMLGNWECESGCEPYRVQGDYQASRAISKAYVAAIENGTQDRERFATDQKGFGLAQWTYPQRKRNLWDFWEADFDRIDSVELQVEFAVAELRSEYPGLLSYLKSAEAIYDATARICKEYERPAVNNVQARYEAALRIRKELDLSGQSEVKPSQSETNEPKLDTWPPRVIDEHCSGWAEVWLLQALLKCRGYNVLVDGIWGSSLTDKVKQFQREHQLDADGAVGPMSWAKLMERG
jgi:peptidoglycan hydrolase-like protein with peptidoglycan-binding domain